MKTKGLVLIVLLGILVAVTVTGCGFVLPSVRPAETSQEEYASSGARAGATMWIINPYQATSTDWYLYNGAYRPKDELLLNVNGKSKVSAEYLRHFNLMPAVSSNLPTVKPSMDEPLIVDVNKCFTTLRIAHWGVAGDYSVDVRSFCTTTDTTRERWIDGFRRPWVANVVEVVSGTDTPALDRFNPVINVYPNNVVRQFLYGIGIGRPGGR